MWQCKNVLVVVLVVVLIFVVIVVVVVVFFADHVTLQDSAKLIKNGISSLAESWRVTWSAKDNDDDDDDYNEDKHNHNNNHKNIFTLSHRLGRVLRHFHRLKLTCISITNCFYISDIHHFVVLLSLLSLYCCMIAASRCRRRRDLSLLRAQQVRSQQRQRTTRCFK